jgi:para-nitrobenzyl esterase
LIRKSLLTAALAFGLSSVGYAQAPAAPAHYNSNDTDLGTLLDDPAAKAVLDKDIPGLTSNDQVDMARGMTLKAMQQYAPDTLTDATLTKVDADLAALPPKK